MSFAKGGHITSPREGGGLSRASEALRRAEQERQAQRSVFNQPREPEWQPDHVRPGGHALEAPMISPDDLIGTGIPTKIAMALKGAAPLIGGLGVIKNKGGNWLTGSVEDTLSGLKSGLVDDGQRMIERGLLTPEQVAQRPDVNLNRWIDKQLTRYVKNEMATPEDPIRALAERGVLHFEPAWVPEAGFARGQAAGLTHGKVGHRMGQSKLAQDWEDFADVSIDQRVRSDISNATHTANPWLAKLTENTPIYSLDAKAGIPDSLGFSHLTDELANALNPESGLPRHLLLDPKSMDRVSVPQAVERVSQINAWRAAQKAEADMLRANNAATHLHKEYPDKGFKWVELKQGDLPEGWSEKPDALTVSQIYDQAGAHVTQSGTHKDPRRQALRDALKYEGDTMGHCVGGYCDDVASGRTKIYSLRDAKGQPHVTVEARPPLYGKEKALDAGDPYQYPSIVQIKGKQNRAPNDEYLPFVQDFVKSGKWSDVGDLQNSGLKQLGNAFNTAERAKLEAVGHNVDPLRYITKEEALELQKVFGNTPDDLYIRGFAHGGSVDKNNLSVQQLQAIIAQLRQEHN